MGKSRRRGPERKSTSPSALRVAKREGRFVDLTEEVGEETDLEDVVESIEDRAAAFAQELSALQSANLERERSVTTSEVSWEPNPEPEENEAATHFDNEEVPRSPTPTGGDEGANDSVEREGELPDEPQVAEDDAVPSAHELSSEELLSGGSDKNRHCLCICRISSNKYSTIGADQKARRLQYDAERREEGEELARRFLKLAPFQQFKSIAATCHKRHSFEPTDYTNPKVRNQMGKDLREYFRKKRGDEVIVLIRAIDGLTIDPKTMENFLTMIKEMGVEAEIVFQYNKVFDEIRLPCLQNYRGLGAVARFAAKDFLDHLKRKKEHPDVRSVLRTW